MIGRYNEQSWKILLRPPPMFSAHLVFLTGLLSLVTAKLHVHDATFAPDQILRVTAQNITQGCLSKYSVLVNGEKLGDFC
jgi:hypothetical protein